MAKDKAVKVEREYKLTDDSVNVYGFRLLSSGFVKEKYLSNPIGFRQHNRDTGIVVRWEDFRFSEDGIFAKPTINLSNPSGQQTLEEVENGFLNAASVGKIVVLEISEDEHLKLSGQEGPTVTKWYPKEISLVDLPGNENALAPIHLEDKDGNEIKDLADFSMNFNKQNKKAMDFKTKVIGALNLADQSTDEEINLAITKTMQKAGRVEGLERDLELANTAKEKAVQDLEDLKVSVNKEKVEGILDLALEAGKITVKAKTDLTVKYADDPEGLQSLVDALPVYQPVSDKLKDKGEATGMAELSWDELDRKGKLEDYKAEDLEGFKEKYKEKFGTDYTEK